MFLQGGCLASAVKKSEVPQLLCTSSIRLPKTKKKGNLSKKGKRMALNMPHKTYISNPVQSASIQTIEMYVLK